MRTSTLVEGGEEGDLAGTSPRSVLEDLLEGEGLEWGLRRARVVLKEGEGSPGGWGRQRPVPRQLTTL